MRHTGMGIPSLSIIPLSALALLSACTGYDAKDAALAAEIERAFSQAHPDVPLDRAARFYVRESPATVAGTYYIADPSGEPLAGTAGKIVWTTNDALPDVSDGGCYVILVDYDLQAKKLCSAQCSATG